MKEDKDKPPEHIQAAAPRSSLRRRLKRLILAGLIGASSGAVAVGLDQHETGGLLRDQLRNVLTDSRYRDELSESIASGEIVGDLSDLLSAASHSRLSSEAEPSENEFVASSSFVEKLSIQSPFLKRYFRNYEIRSITSTSLGTEIKPLFIAQVDNPTIVDFNEGSESNPLYDAWETEARIGPFTTLPTNQTTNDNNHAFYSAYAQNDTVHEYLDVPFTEAGANPHEIRAAALVLFLKDGKRHLIAIDSRDFTYSIHDETSNGKVEAIESYGASISSTHENEDIFSLKQLRGELSKLLEYTRPNYSTVFTTYSFPDRDPETFVFGIYTELSTLPVGISQWNVTKQLSPQDFYSLASAYGKDLGAESWVTVIVDPGTSSTLYDPRSVLADQTGAQYHSRDQFRPRFSLVQLADG